MIPSWKLFDKKRAGESSNQSSYRSASVQHTLGSGLLQLNVEDVADGVYVELSEVDDGVSEVKRR